MQNLLKSVIAIFLGVCIFYLIKIETELSKLNNKIPSLNLYTSDQIEGFRKKNDQESKDALGKETVFKIHGFVKASVDGHVDATIDNTVPVEVQRY
jgi:hypothetical protein